MTRTKLLTLILSAVTTALLLTSPAMANGISPVVINSFLHLVIGNAFIGIFEGWLISWFYRVDSTRAILLMIAANYVSAWSGVWLQQWLQVYVVQNDAIHASLTNIRQILAVLVLVFFLTTAILEWIFCYWALKKPDSKSPRIRRSLGATFAINAISYTIIVLLYLPVCRFSLLTDVDYDPSLAVAKGVNATVYYISVPDGDVYSIKINGTGRRKILDAQLTNLRSDLTARKSADGKHWDLWVSNYDGKGERVLVSKFAPSSTGLLLPRNGQILRYGTNDLRPDSDREKWTIYHRTTGLHAVDQGRKNRLSLSLETPLMSWFASNTTVLPGEIVVIQLGLNVTVLDVHQRKISTLTYGRAPLVVLEKN